MKCLFCLLILGLIPVFVISQNDTIFDENVEEWMVFGGPEVWPQFPGGDLARMDYLVNHAAYTKKVVCDGANGTVYLTFVVRHTGEVSDVRILRGVHPDLDSIALKTVNDMPRWIPAENRGKPIDCQFNMPIKFELPKPSRYWRNKGLRTFNDLCRNTYHMTEEECACRYRFIIWKYNSSKLTSFDLDEIFKNHHCK